MTDKSINHKSISKDFIDSVKSAIKSIKDGFKEYGLLYSEVRDKIARLPSDASLPREISDLQERVKAHLNFATSMNNMEIEKQYMADIIKTIQEKEIKYTKKVWDIKAYGREAKALRELLVGAIREYFRTEKKKPSKAVYEKYAPLFNMPKDADVMTVVTAINNILKNDTNHRLVDLLQRNLNEKFDLSHTSRTCPLIFANSRSHKPQIVFDLRVATANIYNDFFKDHTGAPSVLAHTAMELDKKILLLGLLKKVEQIQKNIALKAKVKSLESYVKNMENNYKDKIEQNLIFGIHLNDIKKCVKDLRKPEVSADEVKKSLQKIENSMKRIYELLAVDDEKFYQDIYGSIKEILLGSPDLKKDLGKMVTYVEHAENVDKDEKPGIKKRLEILRLKILGEDAREYLAPTPKNTPGKFFGKSPVNTLKKNLIKFLQVVGLITPAALADREKMMNIQKELDAMKLPKEEIVIIRESTAKAKLRGVPQVAGALYKRGGKK